MLSWLLLILVLAFFIVLGTWFWGTVFGRGEVLPPLDPSTVTEHNRRVLEDGDLDDLRFEIVPRGYRPEQVDEVILTLRTRLAEAEKMASHRLSTKKD